MEYVQHFQGYDNEVSLEFTLNFGVEQSMVVGTLVEVIEETVVEVTGFPRIGERWYSRRTSKPEILQQFLELGEALVKKGTKVTPLRI
jgi:hypothetical protein